MNANTTHAVALAPLHSQSPLSLLQSTSLVTDHVAVVGGSDGAGGVDDGGGEDDGARPVPGALNVPYAVLEGLVAVGATVGNGLVIVAFRRERRLRRRTNYYIVSLAIADLLVGLVGIPCAVLSSVGLPKQLHLCVFSVSLIIVLCTVSILSLVAVSADRYWAILYPMAYSTNSNTKIAISIICVCWIMGLLIGFMPLMGWRAIKGPKLDSCEFSHVMDYNYLVFLYLATIILPALFMATSYAHIYTVVIKQIKQMTLLNGGQRGGNSPTKLRVLGAARKSEVKATQNLSIIVAFFAVCWMPLYTINCVQAFCKQCTVPMSLIHGCIVLSHLNSAVNPLLYAYHLKDFRNAFKSLLLCRNAAGRGHAGRRRPSSNCNAAANNCSVSSVQTSYYSSGGSARECWRWSTKGVVGTLSTARQQSGDLSKIAAAAAVTNACDRTNGTTDVDPSVPVLLSVHRLVQ
ncbi:G protein-coupled receptor, rhodopsin-like,GPCR, rhodopsin-like, 7TM [Cinara cedri]|uniref:G protein-coupled receptor, rhodopsin-like,GPCR, rhodopsin-like, 7TM n=1 Tax=Cinara cedri TaxID=506608 RepID=A0A5E4N6R0_9HEMI|nr:G protein-coupled receptor, rhodopsin-like,GPCR, rhodopsin-like, 7TM [Cinara cedri]